MSLHKVYPFQPKQKLILLIENWKDAIKFEDSDLKFFLMIRSKIRKISYDYRHLEKRLDWYLIGYALFFMSKLPKPYVLYTLVSRNSRQQKLDKKTSFDEVPQVQLLHIQGRRNPVGSGGYHPHPHLIFWQRRQPYSNQERADYAHPQIFKSSYGPATYIVCSSSSLETNHPLPYFY